MKEQRLYTSINEFKRSLVINEVKRKYPFMSTNIVGPEDDSSYTIRFHNSMKFTDKMIDKLFDLLIPNTKIDKEIIGDYIKYSIDGTTIGALYNRNDFSLDIKHITNKDGTKILMRNIFPDEYAEYLNNQEPINELFGLRDKIKNSFSKMIGGNVKKIDNALNTYKDEYAKLLEEKTSVLNELENENSEDVVKSRLTKLDSALDQKKQLIIQKLKNNLKTIIKNEREQTYADIQENSISLELINQEIEMLSKLKVKTNLSKKLDKLKKDTQKQIQNDNTKLKELKKKKENSNDSGLVVGSKIKYTKKDGEETENTLVKVNNNTITIQTDSGEKFDIDKKNIVK